MGMLNKERVGPKVLLGGVLLVSGLSDVLWSASALQSFWRMVPAREAVTRIIADEKFKPGVLAGVLTGIETKPVPAQPELSRANALLQLRLAEEATMKSSNEADHKVTSAEESVEAALAVTPSDSFLWLMMYSVETARSGFDPTNLRYLNQSYAMGPHEGWISLRRNRLALAILPVLDKSTQEHVVSEFAELVDSDFTEQAAVNLIDVGWNHRELLLRSLQAADIANRRSLARRLSRDGVRVVIPGVEGDERPWR